MRTKVGLALLLLTLPALLACKSSSPSAPSATGDEGPAPSLPSRPAVVGELIVRDLSPELVRVEGVNLDVPDLVRRSLAESAEFRVQTGARAQSSYSLGFGLAWTLVAGDLPAREARAGHLFLVARAELGRELPGHLPEEYAVDLQDESSYDPTRDGPLSEALAARVRALVDLARDRLVLSLRLAGGAKAELLDALASGDAFQITLAARQAAERDLRDAVPTLVSALDNADPEARATVIAALGRLGDPRAVPGLAARTEGMDMAEVRLAVFALGDIGGAEARRYLESIRLSHPDESVRDAAGEALSHEVR